MQEGSNTLVTGVNGFVGSCLSEMMLSKGLSVRGAVRDSSKASKKIPSLVVGEINAHTNWHSALEGCDAVVHLASRVHVMKEDSSDPLAKFREVNVEGTANLAHQAVKAGVKRFIFISSIKVNGESTCGVPFNRSDNPHPQDPYGISKCEAEKVLIEISNNSAMEVVIIRPPLIYGPGVKGNLLSISRVVQKSLPLPLGGLKNRRDMVSIYNLCDLIMLCLTHPSAANKTFLVSDDSAISTSELVTYMARGMGKKTFLLPAPVKIMEFVARVFNKSSITDRLFGSLEVDISDTKKALAWKPPYSVEESFKMMFSNYKTH